MATQSVQIQAPRRLFTADEFQRMAEVGIFSEDDRLELIEGEIVEMTPIGPRHIWCVNFLASLFARFRSDLIPSVQNPIRLGPRSEPQPDLALVRLPVSRTALPEPPDILLVVEVADTTVAYDRKTKGLLYARAGIPEYWLVDLKTERIEVYWDPSATRYQQMRWSGRGQEVRSQTITGLAVRVDQVIG